MIELLKEIILDAQENELFTGIIREINLQTIQKKASIIIGVRRSGKSTYLNQIIAGLKSKGISKENILYINFFDDRLTFLKNNGIDKVLEAYFLLFPYKKNSQKIYCFFDEIQVIPGWEAFIDRILRTENCEVYITGSSAKMLSKEIATQMRGRSLSWEMFPFSFKEFLISKNIIFKHLLTTHQKLIIQNTFNDYLEKGGFPEVNNLAKFIRIKLHQEYFNSIIFRDLIERYDISHPRAVMDLANRLLDNIASLYTLNSLTNFLKSLGHKVPKNSVSEYLAWFEDAYFLFTVRVFDASYSKSNANPKKIYCIDHSFVKSVSSGILVNSGHLLENLVFVSLRRIYSNIYYYKTKNNLEVDFLVQTRSREIYLYQVSESLVNPATRQREITAIENAMNELNTKNAVIITLNEQESISSKSGLIEVIPIWKFLLEFE
jgi:predicted AAA+ superfamily ATPase